MKKLLVLLVSLMVLSFAFADVSFSGGVDVGFTLTSSPLTVDDSLGLTYDRINLVASGDGYYLNIRWYDDHFYIRQAYMTFSFDPVTLYVGKKYYWLNPYAFANDYSLIWNYYGSAWYYPSAYLGARASFDMGSVYVTLDPRFEEGVSTPTVNVFGSVAFDPVSVGFIADDNFKNLGFGVTASFDPVSVSAAVGYDVEAATMTNLLVGAQVSFDPVTVLLEADLSDFTAVVVNGVLDYAINDTMDAGFNGSFAVADSTFSLYAWLNYYFNDSITLTPSVSFDGETFELGVNAHFDF